MHNNYKFNLNLFLNKIMKRKALPTRNEITNKRIKPSTAQNNELIALHNKDKENNIKGMKGKVMLTKRALPPLSNKNNCTQ
jgi:hypothetical protein